MLNLLNFVHSSYPIFTKCTQFFIEFTKFCIFSVSIFYNSIQRMHSFFIRIHENFVLESTGETLGQSHPHSTLGDTPIRTRRAYLHSFFFFFFFQFFDSDWNLLKFFEIGQETGPIRVQISVKKKRVKKLRKNSLNVHSFFPFLSFTNSILPMASNITQKTKTKIPKQNNEHWERERERVKNEMSFDNSLSLLQSSHMAAQRERQTECYK